MKMVRPVNTSKAIQMPRNRKTVRFSMPPEMENQLRQVVEEEDRSVSQVMREAFRLYLEEREWRIQEQIRRRRSRHTEQQEGRARQTDD